MLQFTPERRLLLRPWQHGVLPNADAVLSNKQTLRSVVNLAFYPSDQWLPHRHKWRTRIDALLH